MADGSIMPAGIPIDDPETVEIFYKGDTFGVFYFESPATRQVLKKVASGFTLEEYCPDGPLPSQCGGHLHHPAGLKPEHPAPGSPGSTVNPGTPPIPC